MLLRDATRRDLDPASGEVLSGEFNARQDTRLVTEDRVAAVVDAERSRRCGTGGKILVALVAPVGLFKIGTGPRVGAAGAGRRRRGEELEHAQGLAAVGVDVLPGIGAERRAVPRRHVDDVASLRAHQDHLALEHVEILIGTEDRAELLGVAVRPLRADAEDKAVHLVRRGVDPVVDLASLVVAPDVARHVGAGDARRAVERGARGGRVLGHD